MFRVGQEVYCIRDDWFDGFDDSDGPKIGDICVITKIHGDTEGTWLNLKDYSSKDCFLSEFFRPLVETNIEIFQAMLVNPHREVETCD